MRRYSCRVWYLRTHAHFHVCHRAVRSSAVATVLPGDEMNRVQMLTRGLATSASRSSIKTVTVVGAGLMGSGIAQVAAQAGQTVNLVDVKQEFLDKAHKSIQTNLHRVARKQHKDNASAIDTFVSEALKRIKFTTKVEEAVDTDLVVEAIIENLDLKHQLFSKIDGLAPEHTIFATNTSSLSVDEIGAVLKRQDRYGGLHFFNPVPVMRLLEVIKGAQTSEDTYNKMMEWGQAVGKTCITCKDTPGFVVNRLLGPIGAEAMRMYERGDATAEDIDLGMKLGAGYPMGPLELADYTGLDTNKYALATMLRLTGNPVFEPIPILDKLVAEGKLGVKSGEGFYKYGKK